MAEAVPNSNSIDVISTWKIPELKAFCRRKGLKAVGRKEELVARIFFALESDLPDVLTEKEELKLKADRYTVSLKTDHGRLPDPFTDLMDGWINEDKGKYMWPPTMYVDICEYLYSQSGDINKSITKKALNDYKEGKAFSYFDSNWLKEIQFHPISDDSIYCFVKAFCAPSQKIKDIAHKMWILIKKKNGAIQSAYCTCFAGLGSSCNHIAAVLFKMDFYWRQGLTNKTCTSNSCQWNKYGSEKTVLQPSMIKDLDFRKPQFGKVKTRKVLNRDKQSYLSSVSNPFTFDELFDSLSNLCPEAVVFQPKKILSPQDVVTVEVNTSPPEPLFEKIKASNSCEEIISVLNNFDNEAVSSIEVSTKGQAKNSLWNAQRKCRITSSNVHDVFTKINSINHEKCSRSKDCENLLKCIMGETGPDLTNIPAIKYGREMEKEATNAYTEAMGKSHKCFSVSEVGLIIKHDRPQYGASPDGLTNCLCCGTGLLEVKCPLSVSHEKPSELNLTYLNKSTDSSVVLRNSHRYYSQVQWQMGICAKMWCDLFIYSRHGYHLQRINFDVKFFDSLLMNADQFYSKYFIPSVLSGMSSQNDNTANTTECVMVSPGGGSEAAAALDYQMTDCFITQKQRSHVKVLPNKRRRSLLKKSTCMPIYLCGLCSEICKEVTDIENDNDNSVQCSKCLVWFHFHCIGKNSLDEDDWLCLVCT